MQSSAGQEFLRLVEDPTAGQRAAPARDRVRDRARDHGDPLGSARLAGRRPGAARRCARSPPPRNRSRRATSTAGSACPARAMSSGRWRTRSTGCSRVWRRRSRLSGGSSPTPRTSCAPRWRRCAPHWTWRSPNRTCVAAAGEGAGREPPRGPRPGRPPARELPGARARAARRAAATKHRCRSTQLVDDALASRARARSPPSRSSFAAPSRPRGGRAARRCWRGWSTT